MPIAWRWRRSLRDLVSSDLRLADLAAWLWSHSAAAHTGCAVALAFGALDEMGNTVG